MAIRKNSGKQIVDTIKKVTTHIGVVKGLYGDAYSPISDSPSSTVSGWYFFKLFADHMPSLSEAYENVVRNNVVPEFLPVERNNRADIDSATLGSGIAKNLLFFITGVEVEEAVESYITVDCPDSKILVYVNNRKVAEEFDKVWKRKIFLGSSEKNVIQILIRKKVVDGSKSFYFNGYIEVDKNVPLIFTPPVPGQVVWDEADGIFYGSLDGTTAAQGLILSWYDNPFAAGWLIERISYEGLGVIGDVTAIGSVASGTAEFVFVVSGAHSPINSLVAVDGELIGSVTGYSLEATTTEINVDSDLEQGEWEGETFYIYKETSTVGDVDRKNVLDTDFIIQYVDTAVIEGMPYSYRVAARPIHDRTIYGPFSELQTEKAIDVDPPGPIILWPDEMSAVYNAGDLVTVQHLQPADADLRGYKIYIGSGANASFYLDLRRGTEYMRLDGYVPSGIVNPPDRYAEFDFRARHISGVNANEVIAGYTVTTYDYAGNELSLASGTYFSVAFLVGLPENFTSYDNVVSPNENQRKPDGIPQFMWDYALTRKQQDTSYSGE